MQLQAIKVFELSLRYPNESSHFTSQLLSTEAGPTFCVCVSSCVPSLPVCFGIDVNALDHNIVVILYHLRQDDAAEKDTPKRRTAL